MGTTPYAGRVVQASWCDPVGIRGQGRVVISAVAQEPTVLGKLERHIPSRYRAVPQQENSGESASVLVICVSGGEGRVLRRLMESVAERASWSPVVLACWCSPAEVPTMSMAGVSRVVFPNFGLNFEDLVHSLCVPAPLRELAELTLSHACVSPIAAGAVRRTCDWQVDATREPKPFESVAELAKAVGCCPSFLYRDARRSGLDLGALVRSVRVIAGLHLYRQIGTWLGVATRLGFPSASAWSNFVKRGWGLPPSRAHAAGPPYWLACAIASVLPGPETRWGTDHTISVNTVHGS